MNKQQKQVQQQLLNNEKDVLNKLKSNYKDALDEINSKIEILMARQDADMQHVIYQVEYQKALKNQVQSILEQLQNNEFETVSEYLTSCYEDGFIGTMYDLQGQGIPLVIPIDQEQVLAAIQHETKLSEGLYTALGKDIKNLQKKIAGEISRGISSGQMFQEIARNISNYAGISRNNAMRIARTEGHRIQCKATSDAQFKAKDKGADVVKQWDASLDGKTRDTHRQLDGQIRELEEPFEVAGKKAMYPGGFGDPAEDCNCRCALLQRARWNLGSDYTKWSPDAPVLISDDGTTQFVKVNSNSFKEFKGYYKDITGQMTMNLVGENRVRSSVQKIKMAVESDSIDWGKPGEKITREQYKELMQYAKNKNISLSGFKYYDGKIDTIKTLIDDAESVARYHPEILEGRKKLTIELSTIMNNKDFAETKGHIISINANAYRNEEILKKEYEKLVNKGWFVKGTDYHSIIKHEIGHVYANAHNIDSLRIAKEATGIVSTTKLLDFVGDDLSLYASQYENGQEIISEVFSCYYGNGENTEFVLRFLEICGIL